MAAAYGTIANGGIYVKPEFYTRVLDSEGNVVLENKIQAKRVMDEGPAYIMTDMMKGVITSGTGSVARLSNMPAAGKTGTTSDTKDKWFVGYTPYYVGAAWFGYDQPKAISSSANYSARAWKYVMEKAHKDLPEKNFIRPSNIVTKAICIDSGKLPGPYCKSDPRGNRVREEIFVRGTEPTEICGVHDEVSICKVSGLIATNDCPTYDVY
jgi:penicillin-binding protein 1A